MYKKIINQLVKKKLKEYKWGETENYKYGDKPEWWKGQIAANEVEDKVSGGKADNMSVQDLADKHNVSVDDIKAELKVGLKIEMEHTDDKTLAWEIAKDHVSEFPDYYTNPKYGTLASEKGLKNESDNKETIFKKGDAVTYKDLKGNWVKGYVHKKRSGKIRRGGKTLNYLQYLVSQDKDNYLSNWHWVGADGIKESINEAYVVMYSKQKGEKPAVAAYRDKDMALKFEKELKKDGYITMVKQQTVKGVDESKFKGQLAGDTVKQIAKELSYYIEDIVDAPQRKKTYLKLKNTKKGVMVVKMLRDLYGIESRIDDKMFYPTSTIVFDNNQIIESVNEVSLKKGDKLKFKDGSSLYILGPKGDGYDYSNGREKGHHPKGWFDMMLQTGKAVVESINESIITEGVNDPGILKAIFLAGGPGCFVDGTLVKTEHGYKNISEIQIGENVYTINEDTKEIEIKPVMLVHKYDVHTEDLLELEFEGGIIVRCTENHLFYVDGKWIKAKDLDVI